MKDKIYRAFEILGFLLEFLCPFLLGAELIWRNTISGFIMGLIIIIASAIYKFSKLEKRN